jgi:hypothetical protein
MSEPGTSLGQHFRDFGGAMASSAVATAADGVLFALLVAIGPLFGTYSVGISATLGAGLGAIVNYSLCRFVVFKRFNAPIAQSASLYIFMSVVAGLAQGVGTESIARLAPAGVAWFASKAVIYVCFTYPFARFVVFRSRTDASDAAEQPA